MSAENNYQMINVIVNKGYAEDAMAAARKAGAGGGTIIGARGTAKEGDAAFFGMKIVPEKEMLMILVPAEKKISYSRSNNRTPLLCRSRKRNYFLQRSAGLYSFRKEINLSISKSSMYLLWLFAYGGSRYTKSPFCAFFMTSE